MQNIKKIIGMNLRYKRFQTGLSQERFYEKYGLNSKYLSSIERGEINIGVEMLENLSKTFEIPLTELITYNPDKIIRKKRIDERDYSNI